TSFQRRSCVALACALLGLIVSALPAANREDDTPGTHSVEIFRCDFSDKDDSNFDLWPDGWTRLRGPGYPQYVKIGIVDELPPQSAPLTSGAKSKETSSDAASAP